VRFVLTVKDTGIGISDELQNQIFEEFSQADPSVTRKYGGTGLGLTIVKRLTEIQGGELSIESKPNIGTSITISIPYKTNGEYVEKRVEISEHLKFEKPFNVLVIDDDDVNRLITEELLKTIGAKVHSTGNPTEAHDLIANNSLDLIFTDIQMPEISGYDIVQSLTKLGISTPVIAMTANSMIDNPNHFTESGFAGHLIKPFAEADLINIIKPFAEFTEIQTSLAKQKEIIEQSYDLSDIYRFASGDKESAKLILSTFIDNTDINLKELNHLIEDKNIKGASEIAHKMKPTFKQFKISDIANLLQKIEKPNDNQDNLNEVKALIEEINIQVKPIIKALKKELEQM
jgi:CheY-like chemotaxis protein/HPt (histidine-containing phosphotransfer) domain-containing protein